MPDRPASSSPRILLLDTNRWAITARLAADLCDMGGCVAAVCPFPGHPIRSVLEPKQIFRYSGQGPLESLTTAIEKFEPEIIVPSCDRSVRHLHELYDWYHSKSEHGRTMRALIERSLGPADSFATVGSRYRLLMLAAEEGIRIAETIRLDTIEDLRQWKQRPPWLLKADGTCGGRGVRSADSFPSAEEALLQLTTRASLLKLGKQLLLNRDRDWALSNWLRKRPGVIAQTFIHGRPANCAVVSWRGEVLAGIAVEVLQTDGPCQPASVVQVVEGREMLHAAKQIARRLQLSGFFGLDFMIEDETEAAYLIEMNPRCTPPCSLSLGEGRDLVAAIWAKWTAQIAPQRELVTQKTRIAYFPQAVLGNLNSPNTTHLNSAYLDIPREPRLMHELLHPWPERSLAGRLLDHLRSNMPQSGQLWGSKQT